jgi:hypothetical protein
MMAALGNQAPMQTGSTTGGPGKGLGGQMNHMVQPDTIRPMTLPYQPTVSPGLNLTHDVKPNAGPSDFTPMGIMANDPVSQFGDKPPIPSMPQQPAPQQAPQAALQQQRPMSPVVQQQMMRQQQPQFNPFQQQMMRQQQMFNPIQQQMMRQQQMFNPIQQQMMRQQQPMFNPMQQQTSGLQAALMQMLARQNQPMMRPQMQQMPQYGRSAQMNPLAFRPDMTQAQQSLNRVQPSVYKTDLDAARARIAELEAAQQPQQDPYYGGGG